MTLCLNLPLFLSSEISTEVLEASQGQTTPGITLGNQSVPEEQQLPPGSAGCSPGQLGGMQGPAQLLPGSQGLATRQLQPLTGFQPGLAGTWHLVLLLTLSTFSTHRKERERKLHQIWLGHDFGKGKATPAARGLKSCSRILQEWLLWLLAGLQHSLSDVVVCSKQPFRKHIYQGQTAPRAHEWLISQLTHGVRLKAHESFEERGKNWLVFKVKKQEIQVQLLSRLHKAGRKLPLSQESPSSADFSTSASLPFLLPHFI